VVAVAQLFDVVSVYTLLSAGFKKPGFFQKSPTHRVLLGFFGFYWVLLGFFGFFNFWFVNTLCVPSTMIGRFYVKINTTMWLSK